MEDITLAPFAKKKLSDFVEESLNDYIDSLLKDGRTKLPPEIELAQDLSVSRTTIRRALSNLENRGVILRIHGKGTFINPNLSQAKLNITSGLPLLQLIENCGFKASVKVLDYDTAQPSPLQQSALKLKENSQIINISRVYYADKIPVVLLIDNIPAKYIGKNLSEKELENSTFELIRKHAGVLCIRDEVHISTANSGSIAAYTMGSNIINSDTALVFDIINYNEVNLPIFISKQFFNTNYITFNMVRILDVYE